MGRTDERSKSRDELVYALQGGGRPQVKMPKCERQEERLSLPPLKEGRSGGMVGTLLRQGGAGGCENKGFFLCVKESKEYVV